MNKQKLRACPFCGSGSNDPEMSTNYQNVIICPDCGVHCSIDTWNTRPLEDALQSRIEELELRLDVYHGNMYDVVCEENKRQQTKIVELEKELGRVPSCAVRGK